MWKNYLLTAWRNIIRSPGYFLINVVGLTIGLVASFCMLTFAWYELSYDRQYSDFRQIYAVTTPNKQVVTSVFNIPDELQARLGSNIELARHYSFSKISVSTETSDSQESVSYVSGNFFEIFNFHFIEGNKKNALTKPLSVVLPKEISYKLFGTEKAIGKTLKLKGKYLGTVTGVIDIPGNSSFPVNIYLPRNSFKTVEPEYSMVLERLFGGERGSGELYVKHKKTISYEKIKNTLNDILSDSTAHSAIVNKTFVISPIHHLHFSDIHKDYNESGFSSLRLNNRSVFYGSLFIAIAILMIACLNSISLSVASFNYRRKEIFVRQMIGSTKKKLFNQFLIENILITGMSSLLAMMMLPLIIPLFGNVVGSDLSEFRGGRAEIFLMVILLSVLIGLIINAFQIKTLLLSSPSNNTCQYEVVSRSGLQKFLICIQFFLSTTLIIISLFANSQLNKLQNYNYGMDTNNIINLNITENGFITVPQDRELFLKKINSHPDVVKVMQSSSSPLEGSRIPGNFKASYKLSNSSRSFFIDETSKASEKIGPITAGLNFFDFFEIPLIAGRNFLDGDVSDDRTGGGIILTKTGLKEFGFSDPDEPLGSILTVEDKMSSSSNKKLIYKVIGVCDDFNIGSSLSPEYPIGVVYSKNGRNCLFKHNAKNADDLIRFIKEQARELYPASSRALTIVDESYKRKNLTMSRISKAFTYATLLAIVMASMGLYALSALSIKSRTKEIAIRKVLGGGSGAILRLLLWGQSKPVIVSLVLALPVAYLFLKKLLEYFPTPVPISPTVFILAIVISLTIAWSTMLTNIIQSIRSDPVLTLKNDR